MAAAGYIQPDGTFVHDSASGNSISPGTLTPTAPQDVLLWISAAQFQPTASGAPTNYSLIPGTDESGIYAPWYYRYVTGAETPSVNQTGGHTTVWVTTSLLFSYRGPFTAAITNVSASFFVATVTCNNSFQVGQSVYIQGSSATFLNGSNWVITAATSTYFTVTTSTATYLSAPDSGTATIMPIVQQSNLSATPNAALTFSNPVTPGNLVVFLLSGYGVPTSPVTGLTDNKSTTYALNSQWQPASGPNDGCIVAFGYAFVSASGVTTLNYSPSIGVLGGFFAATAYEIAAAPASLGRAQGFLM